MAAADDDDFPPPLEDMSEIIEKAEKLRNIRLQDPGNYASKKDKKDPDKLRGESCKIPQSIQQHVKQSNGDKTSKQNSKTFGGMKKGFLFGGSNSKKSSPKQEHEEIKKSPPKVESEVPFIQKKETKSNFTFDEVQNAMKTNENLLQNKEWVTEDLLERVAKNPILANRLQDPNFMRALQEFQTNPAVAAEKYKDNLKVQKVFQEFCGIMGDHFSRFSDQKGASKARNSTNMQEVQTRSENNAEMSIRSSTNPNVATAADEKKMQEIISNPEVREILMDPWIQSLIETLKNDPSKGQRMLQGIDIGKQRKLRKLTEVGLLQLQTF